MFAKHGELFAELGVNVNNGLGDIYEKIKGNPKQEEVESDIQVYRICIIIMYINAHLIKKFM